MYYDPRLRNHGLPHDPFKALVVPRPIGWISTIGTDGRHNLAPYSFFNAISDRPPFVMFASSERKDSHANAEETGEFVVNIATGDLRDEMNATSAPVEKGMDEAALAGIEMVASTAVKPFRVARSPVALECVYAKSVSLVGRDGTEHPSTMIIGEVVGIHIDDRVIVEGRVDIALLNPLSRLGYLDYGLIGETFSMRRPSAEALLARGNQQHRGQ